MCKTEAILVILLRTLPIPNGEGKRKGNKTFGMARFCAAAVPEGMAAVEYAGFHLEFPVYQGWKGDALKGTCMRCGELTTARHWLNNTIPDPETGTVGKGSICSRCHRNRKRGGKALGVRFTKNGPRTGPCQKDGCDSKRWYRSPLEPEGVRSNSAWCSKCYCAWPRRESEYLRKGHVSVQTMTSKTRSVLETRVSNGTRIHEQTAVGVV